MYIILLCAIIAIQIAILLMVILKKNDSEHLKKDAE